MSRWTCRCLAALWVLGAAAPLQADEVPTPARLIATLRLHTPAPIVQPAPWDGSLVGAVIAALFGLYQGVISPQDLDACTFAPTCSVFARQAIERHGLVRGVLLGADRLLRDHPFGAEAYPSDDATGRKRDELAPYSAVVDAP